MYTIQRGLIQREREREEDGRGTGRMAITKMKVNVMGAEQDGL